MIKPSQKTLAIGVAAAAENKAEAIAKGAYDKDVDYNIRDRVMWAAVLYSAAEKILKGERLNGREREEVQDLGAYLPHDNYTCFFVGAL